MKRLLVGLMALLPVLGFAANEADTIAARARELRALITPKVERDLRYETRRAKEVRWPTVDEAEEMGRQMQNRQWRADNPGRWDERDPYSSSPRRYIDSPPPDMPARDMQLALVEIESRSRTLEATMRAEEVALQNGAYGALPGLRAERAHQCELLKLSVAYVVRHGRIYAPWRKRGEFKRLSNALVSAIAACSADRSSDSPRSPPRKN